MKGDLVRCTGDSSWNGSSPLLAIYSLTCFVTALTGPAIVSDKDPAWAKLVG